MFKVYAYRAAAIACMVLFFILITPAVIGAVDIYVRIFSDTTTGLINWTDGRGFLALLFALLAALLWIPTIIFSEDADNHKEAIAKAVAERLSR